jgi:glycosyltransferase involved in cell wall biosynthesis
MTSVRIAQVSPLYESVPPQQYGGTERVVSYLTEELVAQGHEVTLFASGDSRTSARLVPCVPRSLRTDPDCTDQFSPHVVMLGRVVRRAAEFDLIHYHVDYLHYPSSRVMGAPHVTTLHGRLNLAELQPLYREFRDIPVVSISDAQRLPLPGANWQATVHHGLPPDRLHLEPGTGRYLAFLGRISPEKRVDRAIEIARLAEMPLRIAAKVDRADRDYFEAAIKPLLRDPLVEYVGEIGEHEKQEFLGQAHALLFPIDWPEPFGLVMIEALACGTPVIAYGHGSVPEIIQHGVTGLVVQDQDQALAAAQEVGRLDRSRCRRAFERRFTATTMALAYLSVYRELIGRRRRLEAPAVTNGAGHVGEDPHW